MAPPPAAAESSIISQKSLGRGVEALRTPPGSQGSEVSGRSGSPAVRYACVEEKEKKKRKKRKTKRQNLDGKLREKRRQRENPERKGKKKQPNN